MKRIWKYFVRIVGVVVLSLILIVAGQLFYVRYFGFHCIQGNCRSGIGVKEFNHTRYSGEFKNYRLNGKGKAEYHSGCTYEGNFVNGYYDGYGIYSCWNMKPLEDRKKLIFEGYWIQGAANGPGTKTTASGKQYSGIWEDDILCLKGNCKNGFGTRVFVHHDKVHTGNWTNGYLNGFGVETDSDGNIVYKGEFKNTHYHGKGTLYKNGKVFQRGEWAEGHFLDPEYRKWYEGNKKLMKEVEKRVIEEGIGVPAVKKAHPR
ncbi:MORN repeat protein [Leptospira borgpetersenii serovar Pomona str. 200901868]|uniref:MORN repeat protein n=1 Tax=Leptospira borgpetersenii serovar Pomona str. 200901868 TaxID=1192866 RepID=M6WTN0_LEPBO|nr:MORN repeat protein [Leptospira borgpetersenii serovar Pomona str. 200901868]